MPADAARLVGELVLLRADDAALRIYDRLLERCADGLDGAVPAPVSPLVQDERTVRTLLVRRAERAEPDAAGLDLAIARLCFRFSALATSAKLFERAAARARLDPEDRIACAFALLKSEGTGRIPAFPEGSHAEISAAPLNPDWQVVFATVLFAGGSVREAATALESAMRARYQHHPDLEGMLGDGRRILECLSGCGDLRFRESEPHEIAAPDRSAAPALRKIFVCGNGWSGSGALYDALTEYDCVAEAPDAAIDRYINACTGNETMFVQGNGGLGRIWRQARDEGRLSRMDLWELFRCHVTGAGGIGHTEHKGANTAANLLERFGSRYTAVFLGFFEAIAKLRDSATSADVREILVETTEALASLITGARDGQAAIFNNAMFGPNIDMVEIFSGFRLAVVVRDPLDQYADRRAQDLKHWMTARRFVSFYRSSREAFQQRKRALHPGHARRVREVEFERFVTDTAYRESVTDWMLDGSNKHRVHRKFEPERSQKNVGIHRQMLSADEREIIDRELRQWRRS